MNHTMGYDFSYFKKVLSQWNLELTEQKEKQFGIFYDLLIEKNKVMNLTAITEFDEVIVKHFFFCFSLCNHYDLTKALKVIDLGTGAGFPGIPLKIMFPNLKMTLADSLNKRILFLNEVIDQLKLSEINTVHGRAEDLASDMNYRETYDLCVSRAVANLSTLSEYCLPFVKMNGTFISYKSGEVEQEVAASKNAMFLLGGKVQDVIQFQLADSENSRSFVIINKIKKTPRTYPRKAGTPTKNPL